MKINDTLTEVPSDWIYAAREALNYRLFSNPLAMSDVIDIVHTTMTQVFGLENITSMEYHDFERTFNFRINMDHDRSNEVRDVMQTVMWNFCDKYKVEIEKALYERYGKGKYTETFDLIMQSHNTFLIGNIVNVNAIYIANSKELIVSIRFF